MTSGTIYFEGSVDSTNGTDGNFINLIGRQIGILNSLVTGNATTNGNWRGNLSAYKFFRLRSVGTLTGTPAILIRMSAGVSTVFLNGSIPSGTNTIGAVTGTFFQATQPVSMATAPTTPVTGTFFQTTQPVSGTFFQTTQPVSLASSPALNTAAKGTTTAGSPTSEATDANTQSQHVKVVNASFAVTGTFFQTTQPVSLATNTPDVTDRVGRLLGQVTNAGTFAVQSAATLSAETTKIIGTVNIAATQTLATVTTVSAVTAITNALPTGANTIGAVNIAAAQTLATVTTVGTVNSVASSTPAVSTTTAATLSSAATTNATLVKASAGNLYSVTASNVGAAAAFLKVFNLATAPTVGTSVPFLTIPIAPSGVANINFGAQGMRMATGISFSITNLVADADATAIAAAQVKVAVAYI